MEYFRTLNLEREPFSNSPDPGLFFNSRQHLEALQQLEISIRLKRGLNVVTGDVGTGKTTLSRQLIQKISHDESIRYFLILDPGFLDTKDFLTCILTHFTGPQDNLSENFHKNFPGDEAGLKEAIKKYLFFQGVEKKATTLLMIDEGQKLPLFCLEALRELLNYETNDHKLLQIIIFAQKEFNEITQNLDNFNDRINFRYALAPLGFKETRALIRFRLEKSSASLQGVKAGNPEGKAFLSLGAYLAIYRYTQGFPRKIINLCHHVMLGLIIKNRPRAGFFFVRSRAEDVFSVQTPSRFFLVPVALAILVLVTAAFLFGSRITDHMPVTLRAMVPVEAVVEVPVEAPAAPAEIVRAIEPRHKDKVNPLLAPPDTRFVNSAVNSPEKSMSADPEAVLQPQVYGSIRVPRDETLFRLIKIVYGSYEQPYVDAVVKRNKNIQNPNHINSGMVISFPVIEGVGSTWGKEDVCILFSRERSFETAFGAAVQYRKNGLDMRLLPLWDRENGFLFSVVTAKPFKNMSEAADYQKRMLGKTRVSLEKISSLHKHKKIL